MSTATVVGSGPNGLACAVELARAGVEVTVLEAEQTIGGGMRSAELTVPGLLHDECSAIHAMGIGSPFFRSLDLERHGLRWGWSDVDLAHPLGDGRAGVLERSIEDTAARLGRDERAWRRMFERPSRGFPELLGDVLGPLNRVPSHPLKLARFGIPAALPATWAARAFKTEEARALWMGCAAHAISPLGLPMMSSLGMALVCSAHAFGWPVALGGSQAIARALAAELTEHGGRIETGVRVRSLDEVADAGAVVLDLVPAAILEIAGDRLPGRVRRAYRSYRHGPAAFKLELAVEGGVPWLNEACRRAGTVHVCGSAAEVVEAEREIGRGRMPERPFLLVGQQYLADPGRSSGDVHPVWTYAHVPHGYDGDASEAIIEQIERFAPGLRERIVGRFVRRADEMAAYNSNFVGGDIIAGRNSPWQIMVRPRLALDPYATGIPGVFICSAATPPGAGVHGMGGHHAARSALRHLGGGRLD